MEAIQTQATQVTQTETLLSHHSQFLDAVTQLTNQLAPLVSLVPGAAPFVIGAKAIEAVAGNVLDSIDNVKNAAQNVVNNSAGVNVPDDLQLHTNLPEIDHAVVDPAAIAAAQIQDEQIPVDQRITKLISDFEMLRNDVQPMIDEFNAMWGAVKGLLKQFGKA